MKKILFGIMLLFIAIGVNATTNVDVKNVVTFGMLLLVDC